MNSSTYSSTQVKRRNIPQAAISASVLFVKEQIFYIKEFSHSLKMESKKENLIMHTKIVNASATDGHQRCVGTLKNCEVFQANLFTAFHETEGINFHMHISIIQSLIFHNRAPWAVSMSHARLQCRITKLEAEEVVRWRRTLGRLPEGKSF